MIKCVCDICGKEIATKLHSTEYKLKKADYSWTLGEGRWINLMIHDSCWRSMCDYIKKSQEEHNL